MKDKVMTKFANNNIMLLTFLILSDKYIVSSRNIESAFPISSVQKY